MFLIKQRSSRYALPAILITWGSGLPTMNAQTFDLAGATDLIPVNVKAAAAEYKGRKAVLITRDVPKVGEVFKDGFAILKGVDFQDGTIEGEIALKITAPPGAPGVRRMPGFIGIAFRARPDASRYDLFYVRPGNSTSDDQSMRNHSVQYTYEPDYGWYKLRRQWPWVYEAWADLKTETWTKIKIEVRGRSAKLFVNGSEQPNLVVDGLKGEDLRGGIALWSYPDEEAYFSNFHIVSSPPAPVKNGSEAAGSWQVTFAGDAGGLQGALQLKRDGNKLAGDWSGASGKARPVTGTWRNGYIELSFDAELGNPANPIIAPAILAGWIDGDAGSGRMKVVDRTDGRWTAVRKP
jgi:hypothetical protein